MICRYCGSEVLPHHNCRNCGADSPIPDKENMPQVEDSTLPRSLSAAVKILGGCPVSDRDLFNYYTSSWIVRLGKRLLNWLVVVDPVDVLTKYIKELEEVSRKCSDQSKALQLQSCKYTAEIQLAKASALRATRNSLARGLGFIE